MIILIVVQESIVVIKDVSLLFTVIIDKMQKVLKDT